MQMIWLLCLSLKMVYKIRLDLLDAYCKTKIMIFTKRGRITRNLHFMYQGCETEIVNKFTYLGIVFITGGSYEHTFDALSGQALNAL